MSAGEGCKYAPTWLLADGTLYCCGCVLLQAYRFWPSEPLVLLCIGVSFLNLAQSAGVPDRNKAVLLGFAFLQVGSRMSLTALLTWWSLHVLTPFAHSTCSLHQLTPSAHSLRSLHLRHGPGPVLSACRWGVWAQEYEQQRGNLHESSYNIARAAHQLHLLDIAHEYYQRCLDFAPAHSPPAGPGTSGEGGPPSLGRSAQGAKPRPSLDLTCEAAYNLALLYQESHAPALARQVYAKHLVVV